MRGLERYTSPSQLDAELRVVFRRLPIIVGRASELPAAGSFFTHDDAGVALLVARDPDGRARAMLNVCTHRGTRLVSEERGAAAAFVCKIHGWTYDLAGRLARPGRVGLPPALEQFMDDRALTSLPCELRHGFVWVLATPRAELDVASALGPLDDRFTALDLASYDLGERTSELRAANWKRIVEAHLGKGAFLLPSSFVTRDGDGLAHVAVFPRAVEESVVVRTQLVRRSVPEPRRAALDLARLDATDAADPAERFHAAIDRLIAAHPRPRA